MAAAVAGRVSGASGLKEEELTSGTTVVADLNPKKRKNMNSSYDDSYSYDPYAPTPLVGITPGNNLMACLFPWLKAAKADELEQTSVVINKADIDAVVGATTKITESPPVAVASEEGTPSTCTSTDDSSLETDKNPSSSPLKGILKKLQTNRMSRDEFNESKRGKNKEADPGNKSRRALFDTLYVSEKNNNDGRGDDGSKKKRKVDFSPMARVLAVESREDLTPAEKADIWWKRSDYNDFKKTSRFISRAMLQKGSEVWLMTNPSWGGSDINAEEKQQDDDSDKWWCRFGHSRRGLEHIKAPEEGKERQRNVQQAIAAVVNEQERQKQAHLSPDDNRIRSAYILHNSWARELCLASGASDAEAVRSNFRRGRCRDYYLSERQTSANEPDFMKRRSKGRIVVTTQISTKRQTAKASNDAPSAAKSLSKKAVGFGCGEDLNMSAALSGMGAVTSVR